MYHFCWTVKESTPKHLALRGWSLPRTQPLWTSLSPRGSLPSFPQSDAGSFCLCNQLLWTQLLELVMLRELVFDTIDVWDGTTRRCGESWVLMMSLSYIIYQPWSCSLGIWDNKYYHLSYLGEFSVTELNTGAQDSLDLHIQPSLLTGCLTLSRSLTHAGSHFLVSVKCWAPEKSLSTRILC